MWKLFTFLANSRSCSLYAVARPSVVCNALLPNSAGWSFRQFFYAVWYLCHPLTSTKSLRRLSQGNPSVRELNATGVANIAILDLSRKRCKIGGKLVLITNRKSYVSFRLVPKLVTLMTLNGVMALILSYLTEFASFRGALRKSGWRCRRKKVHVRYLIS